MRTEAMTSVRHVGWEIRRRVYEVPPVRRWRIRRWLRWLLDQGTTWPDPLTWRDLRGVVRVDKRQREDRDHAFFDSGSEQREVCLLRLDLTFRRGQRLTIWEVDRLAQVKVAELPVEYRRTVDDMAFYADETEARLVFADAVAWAGQINAVPPASKG